MSLSPNFKEFIPNFKEFIPNFQEFSSDPGSHVMTNRPLPFSKKYATQLLAPCWPLPRKTPFAGLRKTKIGKSKSWLLRMENGEIEHKYQNLPCSKGVTFSKTSFLDIHVRFFWSVNIGSTLPTTNSSHLKIGKLPQRNYDSWIPTIHFQVLCWESLTKNVIILVMTGIPEWVYIYIYRSNVNIKTLWKSHWFSWKLGQISMLSMNKGKGLQDLLRE